MITNLLLLALSFAVIPIAWAAGRCEGRREARHEGEEWPLGVASEEEERGWRR